MPSHRRGGQTKRGAAWSGSQSKAPCFAGGYLLSIRSLCSTAPSRIRNLSITHSSRALHKGLQIIQIPGNTSSSFCALKSLLPFIHVLRQRSQSRKREILCKDSSKVAYLEQRGRAVQTYGCSYGTTIRPEKEFTRNKSSETLSRCKANEMRKSWSSHFVARST